MTVRMPAEWERHERCWMIWPGTSSIFASNGTLAPARRAYAAVAAAISRFEPVAMWTNDTDCPEALDLLDGRVEVVAGISEDCWVRDTGPSFVKRDGALSAVAWAFNGYGSKYDPEVDRRLAADIALYAGAPAVTTDLVNEGGAIHVDGQGTLLTTEDVLLNPNRNPGASKEDVASVFKSALGAERTIWLPHGLVQDTDTDGHVDTVAAFTAPGQIVVQVCADRSDPNHDRLQRNLDRLRGETDASGRALEIIEIVGPPTQPIDGDVLSLSYINYYLANGGVVVPVFDLPSDVAALQTLKDVFPDREILPVPALDVFRGGGGIHCITQQQPAK